MMNACEEPARGTIFVGIRGLYLYELKPELANAAFETALKTCNNQYLYETAQCVLLSAQKQLEN